MGLPYILGDKNPKDPVNGWDKTWAYLKELNSCIEYYPTGTGAVMKELGEGSRDMTVTMTGWDINPRVLGIVPKDYKVAPFKGMTWVNDAHYMVDAEGRAAGEDGGDPRPDGVHADAGSAGVHLRQGLLLSRPRGEERAAVDGAEGEPGRDQGVRPAGIRRLARRNSRTRSRSSPRRRSRRSGSGTSRSARRRPSNEPLTARSAARAGAGVGGASMRASRVIRSP